MSNDTMDGVIVGLCLVILVLVGIEEFWPGLIRESISVLFFPQVIK